MERLGGQAQRSRVRLHGWQNVRVQADLDGGLGRLLLQQAPISANQEQHRSVALRLAPKTLGHHAHGPIQLGAGGSRHCLQDAAPRPREHLATAPNLVRITSLQLARLTKQRRLFPRTARRAPAAPLCQKTPAAVASPKADGGGDVGGGFRRSGEERESRCCY